MEVAKTTLKELKKLKNQTENTLDSILAFMATVDDHDKIEALTQKLSSYLSYQTRFRWACGIAIAALVFNVVLVVLMLCSII